MPDDESLPTVTRKEAMFSIRDQVEHTDEISTESDGISLDQTSYEFAKEFSEGIDL